MYPATPRPDDDTPDDLAAFWFARMNGGTPPGMADEASYRAWLRADPSNIEAYRQCQAAWRDLGLDAASPEVMSLRAKALGATPVLTRRRALFGLAGSAIAASAAGVWVLTASSPARAVIVTGAGQRLTAPLPDGSEATLAPLSRLKLDFGGARRKMTLESGQVWFNVLPDPDRPFSVMAGGQSLRVSGGRFQVTLNGEVPDVVVEEGELVVVPPSGYGAAIVRLNRGQKGTWSAGRIRVEPADIDTDTAWRLGRIVVRDRPLREVVDAFNRYSSDRLVLGDPKAGDIRISGSFRYDGSSEFAQALAAGFGVSVARQKDGAWRISASEGTATLR